MKNWTDKIIHWNQLPGTEVKRLLDTWGMTPDQIAKYDRKHGYHVSNTANPVDFPKTEVKAEKPAKAPAKKAAPAAPVKKAVTRQKHTGADGEIKFVEHRNLYVGFMGGRVVVTKRTKEQCLAVLASQYGVDQ